MEDKTLKTMKIKVFTWKPSTQHASLLAVIWFNEIFGLRVFESAGRLRYSWSIIYVSTCTILYFTLLYTTTVSSYEDWPAYQEISYRFALYVNVIVAGNCVLLGFIYTGYSKNIISRCEQIDNILESFGIEKNYMKIVIYTLQVTSVWGILMTSLFVLAWLWWMIEANIMKGLCLSLLMSSPVTIICLMSLTFNIFIRILRDKLHKMNIAMSEVRQLPNENDINIRYKMQLQRAHKLVFVRDYYNQKHYLQYFLQITRQMHFEIVKISRELNHIYCYQLMLELAMQFTIIISTLYNVYFEIISSQNVTEIFHSKIAVSAMWWALISSVKVITTNHHCTCFHREAALMAETLQELATSCSYNSIKDEVQQFSLQLILHPLHLFAGPCLRLNNEFTTKFFGTITTYLAILVQVSSTPTAMRSLIHSLNT